MFVYSLESPRLDDSNKNTQHTFILEKLKAYPYYASCPGTMINSHKLELPLSQPSYHGSKDVRDIEVRLYE